MAVAAYNTLDILQNLFKLGLKNRGLPELADHALLSLDTQIARSDRDLQERVDTLPLRDINAIKTLVMKAQDSPHRKELVKTIAELDSKLISLNSQGEGLKAESKKLINNFWDLVVAAGMRNQPVNAVVLDQLKADLNFLAVKTKPFEDKHEQVSEAVRAVGRQVESMAGEQLANVIVEPQVTKTEEPKP